MRESSVLNRPIGFLSLLSVITLVGCLSGCGGSQLERQREGSAPADGGVIPELTQEIINERINDAWVREVPEETNTARPIFWNFDENEPKEITVVEKQVDGTKATIVLDIKTDSSPRSPNPRHLAGRIRTEWELRTGWVLRRWEIVNTENISMKYKNIQKPPEQNSNR